MGNTGSLSKGSMKLGVRRKTYAKETKLGWSVKNKEQRRCRHSTPDILPNAPKHAVLPWDISCHMRTNDN